MTWRRIPVFSHATFYVFHVLSPGFWKEQFSRGPVNNAVRMVTLASRWNSVAQILELGTESVSPQRQSLHVPAECSPLHEAWPWKGAPWIPTCAGGIIVGLVDHPRQQSSPAPAPVQHFQFGVPVVARGNWHGTGEQTHPTLPLSFAPARSRYECSFLASAVLSAWGVS